MNNQLRIFQDALEKAGIPTMRKHTAAQLLAWLFVHGGSFEGAVVDDWLRSKFLQAQYRLNLHSGESISADDSKLLRRYVEELYGFGVADSEADKRQKTIFPEGRPEWLKSVSIDFKLPPVTIYENGLRLHKSLD